MFFNADCDRHIPVTLSQMYRSSVVRPCDEEMSIMRTPATFSWLLSTPLSLWDVGRSQSLDKNSKMDVPEVHVCAPVSATAVAAYDDGCEGHEALTSRCVYASLLIVIRMFIVGGGSGGV